MWEELYRHGSKGWNFPSPPPCCLQPTRAQKKLPQESLNPSWGHMAPGSRLELWKAQLKQGAVIPRWSVKEKGQDKKREQLWGGPLPLFLIPVCETKMTPLRLKLQRWVAKNDGKLLPLPCLGAWGKGCSQGQRLMCKEFLSTFPTDWNVFNLARNCRSHLQTVSNGGCQTLKGTFVASQMGPITHCKSKWLQWRDRLPRRCHYGKLKHPWSPPPPNSS